ncbi:MAG: 50S ribosomal protein L31, large subunit ribosomal protein L31e [archaeon GW2011_AR3]|nr:MAG: 50S ribosomal protein L31, large subunit ribosomal protein L31e [archaeon GW2011_AR3]
MGSILDSPKEVWHRKENPSGQAYNSQKKLEKDQNKGMITMAVERIYTIPLRKEWLKAPKYRRAKKAVDAARQFLEKHMKSEDVNLGKYLNLFIWKHGIKNPPAYIKVKVTKNDAGRVDAELVDAPVDKKESVDEKVKKAAKAEKADKKAEKKDEEPSPSETDDIREAEVVSETTEKKPKKAPAKKKPKTAN